MLSPPPVLAMRLLERLLERRPPALAMRFRLLAIWPMLPPPPVLAMRFRLLAIWPMLSPPPVLAMRLLERLLERRPPVLAMRFRLLAIWPMLSPPPVLAIPMPPPIHNAAQ